MPICHLPRRWERPFRAKLDVPPLSYIHLGYTLAQSTGSDLRSTCVVENWISYRLGQVFWNKCTSIVPWRSNPRTVNHPRFPDPGSLHVVKHIEKWTESVSPGGFGSVATERGPVESIENIGWFNVKTVSTSKMLLRMISAPTVPHILRPNLMSQIADLCKYYGLFFKDEFHVVGNNFINIRREVSMHRLTLLKQLSNIRLNHLLKSIVNALLKLGELGWIESRSVNADTVHILVYLGSK